MKKAFDDNVNHLCEKEKQVSAYVINLSRGLFELTDYRGGDLRDAKVAQNVSEKHEK